MTTPVSFEIAKLLKDKGFDENCIAYYDEANLFDVRYYIDSLNSFAVQTINRNNHGTASINNSYIKTNYFFTSIDNEVFDVYTAPTIAEVVMWLYEKHSLWILPLPTVCGYFAWKIIDMQDNP